MSREKLQYFNLLEKVESEKQAPASNDYHRNQVVATLKGHTKKGFTTALLCSKTPLFFKCSYIEATFN